jgi:cyclophilin family peptidyl-prolyl cis-trans isomerase
MVQSGSPTGDSMGHPGYRFAVETSPADAARLHEPGALAFARYTPPPYRTDPNPPPPGSVLGSQFFITLTDMSHLAGKVSVLGRCQPLDVVGALARGAARKERRPRLLSVSVQGL